MPERDLALVSKLGQEAISQKPDFTSPAEGLYTNVSLLERPQNTAAELTNLHFIGGSWTSTGTGWTKHHASAFPSASSSQVILEMGAHFLSTGSSKSIVQCSTKVYAYELSTVPAATPPASTASAIFTSGSATLIPCMRSFSPSYFSYVNGTDAPQKYDGTTWAAATGWPVVSGSDSYNKPKYCEPYVGRMAFARFENYKYSVILSVFNDPQDFTLTGSSTKAVIFTLPSKLGPVTGMRALIVSKQNNEEILVVGCERGLAIITGHDANNFELKVVTSNFGILSNRTWIQLDNDLFFFAKDGVRRLSDSIYNSSLRNAALTYKLQDLINRVNLTQFEQAFAVENPDTLEVVFWFPLDAETHNRYALIMNYGAAYDPLQGAGPMVFSLKTTPQETSTDTTWRSPSCGIRYADNIYCGGYNGYIQDHYSGDLYDTEIIQFNYKSPLVAPPTPPQSMANRLFNIMLDESEQEFTVSIYGYITQKDGTLRRTQMFQDTVSLTSGGSTALGTWALGTGEFPADSFQAFEISSPGEARAWEVEISGTTSNAQINLVGIYSTMIVGGTRQ